MYTHIFMCTHTNLIPSATSQQMGQSLLDNQTKEVFKQKDLSVSQINNKQIR